MAYWQAYGNYALTAVVLSIGIVPTVWSTIAAGDISVIGWTVALGLVLGAVQYAWMRDAAAVEAERSAAERVAAAEKRVHEAIAQAEVRVAEAAARAEKAIQRADEAERRLEGEVIPRWEAAVEAIREASLALLREEVGAGLDVLRRMKIALSSGWQDAAPVHAFSLYCGRLVVTVKTDTRAAKSIEVGDEFMLHRRQAAGVVVEMAVLRVRQPPDREKGVLVFEEAHRSDPEAVEAICATMNAGQGKSGLAKYHVSMSISRDVTERLELDSVIEVLQTVEQMKRGARQ